MNRSMEPLSDRLKRIINALSDIGGDMRLNPGSIQDTCYRKFPGNNPSNLGLCVDFVNGEVVEGVVIEEDETSRRGSTRFLPAEILIKIIPGNDPVDRLAAIEDVQSCLEDYLRRISSRRRTRQG